MDRLQQWEARGIRIINRPEGILNCQRQRTVAAFAGSDLAFPETVLIDTAAVSTVRPDQLAKGEGMAGLPDLPAWLTGQRRDGAGAWVKRGDVHATEADDVVYVEGADAARGALRRFHARGIATAAVQRHMPGTVLKFYAVRGRFFHCVALPAGGEIPMAAVRGIDTLGRRAAEVLEVEVYGGDCVVGVNGELTLIDLNDWPSYAPCRARAAGGIAAYLLAQATATES